MNASSIVTCMLRLAFNQLGRVTVDTNPSVSKYINDIQRGLDFILEISLPMRRWPHTFFGLLWSKTC